MRRQRMKGMDRAREVETERDRKKGSEAEWMERMIQQRYRKREKKRGNICKKSANCERDH